MRSKEDIKNDGEREYPAGRDNIIIELLLDIRELLLNAQKNEIQKSDIKK